MLVRKKISIGFVVLGFILLLSSVIAIFEFVSMRHSMAKLVKENIASINTSRLLLEVTDEYNFNLLEDMGTDSIAVVPDIPDIEQDVRFTNFLKDVRKKLSAKEEKAMADSARYAYVAYAHVIREAPSVWKTDYTKRREWYFSKLYPIYMQLRMYVNNLGEISQKKLVENSKELSDAFYRSVMPCVVAVGIGIILLILFDYFLNYYFINPLGKITNGIKGYLKTGRSYTVNLESDDEMQDLNDNVREIITENKQTAKGEERRESRL